MAFSSCAVPAPGASSTAKAMRSARCMRYPCRYPIEHAAAAVKKAVVSHSRCEPPRCDKVAPPSRERLRMRSSIPVLLAGAVVAFAAPASAQDFYKGKTLALYVGQPPGGGMDNEMRIVARYFSAHIPGEP